jgi:hypothetical protein
MSRFIVAEVSKSWPNDDDTPLCVLFERIINHNALRSYILHSWKLDRMIGPATDGGSAINETIIAIFELW